MGLRHLTDEHLDRWIKVVCLSSLFLLIKTIEDKALNTNALEIATHVLSVVQPANSRSKFNDVLGPTPCFDYIMSPRARPALHLYHPQAHPMLRLCRPQARHRVTFAFVTPQARLALHLCHPSGPPRVTLVSPLRPASRCTRVADVPFPH
eukprot:2100914-Pyramimonas_sp.AAC.1